MLTYKSADELLATTKNTVNGKLLEDTTRLYYNHVSDYFFITFKNETIIRITR